MAEKSVCLSWEEGGKSQMWKWWEEKMIWFIWEAEPSFPPFLIWSSWVYPFPANKHLEAIKNAEFSSAIIVIWSSLEEISSETTVNSLSSFEVAREIQTSQVFRAFLLTNCLRMEGFAHCLCFLKMPEIIGTMTGLTVESTSPLSLEVEIQMNALKC